MAQFPGSIFSQTDPVGNDFISASGTAPGTYVDHGLQHKNLNDELNGLEIFLGTNSASNGVFSGYTAGQQPLPIKSGTLGTVITGGTFNNLTFGTPTLTNSIISGGTMQSAIQNNGTVNGGVYGTPTIGSIVVPGTVNALGFSAAIAPGVGTITDVAGGTLTVNAQQGQIFYSAQGTGAGNRTIATPLNPSPYQQLTYVFKTSGSANGTLVWGTVFRISQDYGTPTLGTGISWNYYNFRYNAIDSTWDFIGQMLNLV